MAIPQSTANVMGQKTALLGDLGRGPVHERQMKISSRQPKGLRRQRGHEGEGSESGKAQELVEISILAPEEEGSRPAVKQTEGRLAEPGSAQQEETDGSDSASCEEAGRRRSPTLPLRHPHLRPRLRH